METGRFILALTLSFLVFLVYVWFFAPRPQEGQPVPQVKEQVREKPARPMPDRASAKPIHAKKGRDIAVETDLIRVVINTAGGVITRWELKNYKEASKDEAGIKALYEKLFGTKKPEQKRELGNVQLVPAFIESDTTGLARPLQITPHGEGLEHLAWAESSPNRERILLTGDNKQETLVLSYRGPRGILLEKRLTFYSDEYKIDVDVKTANIDGYTFSLGTDFGIADKLSKDSAGQVGITYLVDGSIRSDYIENIKTEIQHAGKIEWFGQHDKYFTAALFVSGHGIAASVKEIDTKGGPSYLSSELSVNENYESRRFGLYAGPKSYSILKKYGNGLENLVDYGWFAILAKPMFWLLEQFYVVTKNYGIAIILLTIAVRIILFYPSLKSAIAMEEMKALQPEINAIREKYKKDPQKMNQEMMQLYKEKKVNPLGGCLPMLLQLPFFVALYNVLNVSIELRQAPFISFWIKDLSVYDPYYILPVLMGVSMILTMKMTATTIDPMQQKIFMIMNVVFIFLFAWLPAGLLLYITVSNVLSIVQQMIVHRIITPST